MCAEKNLGIWISFKISKDVLEIENDKELLETDNELLEETPKLEHHGKDVVITHLFCLYAGFLFRKLTLLQVESCQQRTYIFGNNACI